MKTRLYATPAVKGLNTDAFHVALVIIYVFDEGPKLVQPEAAPDYWYPVPWTT